MAARTKAKVEGGTGAVTAELARHNAVLLLSDRIIATV
jgi:hypothetical protein